MANISENRNNWKITFLIVGTVGGAVVGLLTAYLLARASDENRGGPPEISTVDMLKAGLGVFGIVRSIASLGDGKK